MSREELKSVISKYLDYMYVLGHKKKNYNASSEADALISEMKGRGLFISQWRPIEEATEEDKNDLRKLLFKDPDWADARDDDWKAGVTVGAFWKDEDGSKWYSYNHKTFSHFEYPDHGKPTHFADLPTPPKGEDK